MSNVNNENVMKWMYQYGEALNNQWNKLSKQMPKCQCNENSNQLLLATM